MENLEMNQDMLIWKSSKNGMLKLKKNWKKPIPKKISRKSKPSSK